MKIKFANTYKLFSLAVLLFGLLLAPDVLGQGTLGNARINLADKKFDDFNYPDAIELYEGVSGADTNIHVCLRLATSYRLINNTVKAEEWYTKSMKLGDLNADQLYNFSQILASNGKYEYANFLMDMLLALSPTDVRANKFQNIDEDYLTRLRTKSGGFRMTHLKINSEKSDFGPSFYEDKIVFASSRKFKHSGTKKYSWTEEAFLNLYQATKGDSGQLNPPQLFSNEVNTKYHEGPTAFTVEGTEVYFTRNNYNKGKYRIDDKGINHLKIYHSTLKDNEEWSDAEEVPFNADGFSTAHPTLSNDGQTMYFSSDRPGGIGASDIYKVTKSNGSWGTPINLGPEINTESDELFPFLHNDKKIFFASNGHPGLGKLDIFIADINTKGTANVVNLGAPINSKKDDFGLIINAEETEGYMSSNRQGGTGSDDLYSFFLVEKLDQLIAANSVNSERASVKQPLSMQLVDNKSGKILRNKEVEIYSNNKLVTTIVTNDNGEFQFEALPYETYSMKISDNQYDSELIEVAVSEEMLNGSKESVKIESNSSKVINEDKQITMQMVDNNTGKILRNTEVEIFVNNKLVDKFKTDENGEFKFEALPLETYNIKISDEKYETDLIEFTASEELFHFEKAHIIEKNILTSNPLDENVEDLISIRLFNKLSNLPLDGTEIELYSEGELVDRFNTNKFGEFRFKALPFENYEIKIKDDVNGDELIEFTPTEDMFNGSKLVAIENDNIQGNILEGNQSEAELLTIRIFDKLSNIPIDGTEIEIYANNELIDRIRTNEFGEFRFEALPLVDYEIKIKDSNYDDELIDFTPTKEMFTSLEPISIENEKIKGNILPGSESEAELISVQLFNNLSKLALDGTEIEVYYGDELIDRIKTNESGEFKFRALPLVNYEFKIKDKQYESELIEFSATEEMLSGIEPVQFKSDKIQGNFISDKDHKSKMLTVKFIDKLSSNPIGNMDIEVYAKKQLINRYKTNERGEFRMKALSLISYEFKIVNEEYDKELIDLIISDEMYASSRSLIVQSEKVKGIFKSDDKKDINEQNNLRNQLLSAVFLNGETGQAISGMTVALYSEQGVKFQNIQTDNYGKVNLLVEPLKKYALKPLNTDFNYTSFEINTNSNISSMRLKPFYLYKTDKIQLLVVVKSEATNKPIEDVSVTFVDEYNNTKSNDLTNSEGRSQLDLNGISIGQEIYFTITLQKRGYAAKTILVKQKLQRSEPIAFEVSLDVLDHSTNPKKLLALKPIYFDFDMSDIRPDAASELNKIVKMMKENPSIEIELTSHTDSRQSEEYNRALSQRRAQSSTQYIISKGISPKRITGLGLGEDWTINGCDDGVPCTKEEHQLNRRTEFRIIKY